MLTGMVEVLSLKRVCGCRVKLRYIDEFYFYRPFRYLEGSS